MSRTRTLAFRLAASILRVLSLPFLLVGWIATPILQASAWCERRGRRDRPPEWLPRLWSRAHNPDLTEPPR